MASQSTDEGAKGYEAFHGEQLMDELLRRGDESGLELLWLLNDPPHCVSLLPRMLQLGTERAVRLVAEQLLNATLVSPFPEALVAALEGELPPLPFELTAELAARLRDEEPLQADYEEARPAIARWVIAQQHSAAAELALEVLAEEVPESDDESVRAAARARCALSAEAFSRAVATAQRLLADEPTSDSWADAAALLEAGVRAGRSRSTMKPLALALIETAAALNEESDLGEALSGFALAEGLRALRALVGGEALSDSPGSHALIAAALGVTDSDLRAELFGLAIEHQPHLWARISADSAEWESREWKRRLAVTERASPVSPAIAEAMIRGAPNDCLREAVRLAVAQALSGDETALIPAASCLEDAMASGEPGVKLVPWALAKNDDSRAHLGILLGEVLDEETQAELVAEAYSGAKLAAPAGAELIPPSQIGTALASLDPGNARAKLALALLSAHEEETLAAVGEIQEDAFSLDLAEAIADVAPREAFLGSSKAYPDLTDADRDALTGLVERFGAADQIPILETIIEDGRKGTANRRLRATRRVGQLVEPRGEIPSAVLRLLGSSNRDLRQAAIEVVESVRPRDPRVIDELRQIAKAGGVPGESSARALDAIAQDIIEELGESPPKEASLALLPLLGKTGSPAVLEYSFGFVGSEPHWDDPEVRRVAAQAIADAAEGMKTVSVEAQTRLVELIEGEEAEVDPQAAEALRLALGRIQLGEDDALNILYDNFLPPRKRPQADPERLFGQEKETIVTHLDLYAKAKASGPPGFGRVLAQLDIVAAGLARAAYLHYGEREPLKEQIRLSRKQQDYASLIGAIGNTPKMKTIRAELEVIRNLRSDRSLEAHPGETATADEVTSAANAFRKIATHCVQLLDDAVRSAG